ncbi:MAG: D-alanyl-D-alanine carboxypeptidase [Lachnospiraceae bacterium]|nr:D-alanyl-D-alanine carboxypeptidase [Lachnospiraceae bacterium]
MKKWKRMIKAGGRVLLSCLLLFNSIVMPVQADMNISSPSVILIEASTGRVVYESRSTERRSPASITKVMTLLLTFEQIAQGNIKLDDQVVVSEYASSMGGSQVFLAEGEVQSLDTMIKCIAVSSGNDASVAVAEHIAGSEAAFVQMMNEKAAELGMKDTHFEDCCGLSDSDDHYTSAMDVAIMSRELTTKYPEIFNYTQIWMEDITHNTRQGSTNFTLNSTNKLLKQYQWATGLKTGSTNKAKYCLAATASKDGVDLIAVVMGAPDHKARFQDATTLLNFGFSVCNIYIDENIDALQPLPVKGGIEEEVSLHYQGEFRYLDVDKNDLTQIEKVIELPESIVAPVEEGTQAGSARYLLNGTEIGAVPIVYGASVEKALYKDYLEKLWKMYLF